MRDYDKLLQAGNKAQLEKLEINSHKSGFNNIDLEYTLKRIKEETGELFIELCKPEWDYEAIRHEFADIANFAHMGILAVDKMLNKDV